MPNPLHDPHFSLKSFELRPRQVAVFQRQCLAIRHALHFQDRSHPSASEEAPDDILSVAQDSPLSDPRGGRFARTPLHGDIGWRYGAHISPHRIPVGWPVDPNFILLM